jgi:signal transduction histidine kinase
MQHEATLKDIPVSLYAELVSRNYTYLYSMLVHDFKGHLSSIAINLELLRETLSLDEDVPAPNTNMGVDTASATRQSIDSIEKEIEHIRSFLQTLLNNVEVPRLSPSPVSLAAIIGNIRDFIASEIKRGQIRIDVHSTPGVSPLVMGDQKVMEQLFLNLFLHMLKPENRASRSIDISLTATGATAQVTFTRQLPEDGDSQPDGFFRNELLVKTGDGENFLDLALHAHGGSLSLDTRDSRRVYTIHLPAIG